MSKIKTILVPFNHIQPSPSAVAAAKLVGTRFGAYIEGVYCRQLMPIIAGEGITLPGDYLLEFEEEAHLQAEGAASIFRNLLIEHDIAFGDFGEYTKT